jgi:hypothetical protein
MVGSEVVGDNVGTTVIVGGFVRGLTGGSVCSTKRIPVGLPVGFPAGSGVTGVVDGGGMDGLLVGTKLPVGTKGQGNS